MEDIQDYINEKYIIKDKIYEEFKFSISCQICTNIIYEPMMCMNCQNVYCKKCIDKWARIKRNCPNRCENPDYKFSISKNELLTKLKFKCKKCNNINTYNNIINHFLYGCDKVKPNIPCYKMIIRDIFKKLEMKVGEIYEAKKKIKSK